MHLLSRISVIAVHDYRVPKDRLISRSQESKCSLNSRDQTIFCIFQLDIFSAWGLEQWHTYSLRVYSFEQVDIIATGSEKDNDDVGIDEIEVC